MKKIKWLLFTVVPVCFHDHLGTFFEKLRYFIIFAAVCGSLSFWASRIRILNYLHGSGSFKNFDFYGFVTSLKTDVQVPTVSAVISKNKLRKKLLIFVSILKAAEEKSKFPILNPKKSEKRSLYYHGCSCRCFFYSIIIADPKQLSPDQCFSEVYRYDTWELHPACQRIPKDYAAWGDPTLLWPVDHAHPSPGSAR